MNSQSKTLNCKGKLIDLEEPIVMGILNISPDSFYDGGIHNSEQKILHHVARMLSEGAKIIDIGGMSSRPGAKLISEEEELKRVLPIIHLIRKTHPEAIISLDTIRAKVAEEGIQSGVSIINDISAGAFDNDLYTVVGKYQVPYILMHMKGKPQTMQINPQYDDILKEIIDFFVKEIEKLRAVGVKDIVLDPGFGFGKQLNDNYFLLKNLSVLKILGLPILAGISRKSMIYKFLEINPAEALNGTSILHLKALENGAKILRVHDVKEATECIKLWQKLKEV